MLDYGRSKPAAETALAEIVATGEPTVASIRLPHVYGAQSVLFGLARRRLVVFPGRGENRFAQLHVDHAAGVLIAAAEQRWAGIPATLDDAVAFRWRHPVFDWT